VDCDTLARGDDDGLNERCGDADVDVLEVTLKEFRTEALSVDIADSDTVTLEEK